MQNIIDLFLHLDEHLIQAVQSMGFGVYGLLFGVVFCETGLIIFPFLPGDSLLFAAGLISNSRPPALNIGLVVLCFTSAAILGDSVNYWIGRMVGDRLFRPHKSALMNKMFKPSHLAATQSFFDKHGAKTVVIGRFLPIIRTLTPFVAGKAMGYSRFLLFSVTGTLLWVGICTGAGYGFGQIPWVRENFSTVILIVCGGTLLLAAAEVVRGHRKHAAAAAASSGPNPELNTLEKAEIAAAAAADSATGSPRS